MRPKILFHHQLRPKRRRLPPKSTWRKPELTVAQILRWADDFHESSGKWPTAKSGLIAGSLGETWCAVAVALAVGLRGLPGKSTLAQLLAEQRGKRHRLRLPHLRTTQILEWADQYHEEHGDWPQQTSGRIGNTGETWSGVSAALLVGMRGLPGGSSLARLLAEAARRPNPNDPPRLSETLILRWARAHRKRTGQWPVKDKGTIPEHPLDNWQKIDTALRLGLRGLPGGSSLALFLATKCGRKRKRDLPRFTIKQILALADEHHQRTGRWPHRDSGSIMGLPGERWSAVDASLYKGCRGLASGRTLSRLLYEHRGVRSKRNQPRLSKAMIRRWAKAHLQRTGKWPTKDSGTVADEPGESWRNIDVALRDGYRGLPGGSSLAALRR